MISSSFKGSAPGGTARGVPGALASGILTPRPESSGSGRRFQGTPAAEPGERESEPSNTCVGARPRTVRTSARGAGGAGKAGKPGRAETAGKAGRSSCPSSSMSHRVDEGVDAERVSVGREMEEVVVVVAL